ncbi:Uncharacterized protein MSYG_1933 [Malassezia sympodialis ATCC 42132]|uniref:Uncharacterized protein n=1 Tax=Malassezia sympodialis (strain ATCC 42132) TaxID=1230383 RepID=A0A1M8A590_MALS4|nr:Uncharacterized protein MSYG_1933 [Malassezia sympodialis ATCC 42132]
MATSTSSQAPVIQSETVDFIAAVPLVSGAVDYALSIVKSHSLLQKAYDLAETVTVKALSISQPIVSIFSQPLHILDHTTLKVLTFAKSKVPYPFEVKWEDLYAQSRAPIEQGQKLANDYCSKSREMYDTHVKGTVKNIYEKTGQAVEQLQQNEQQYLQKTSSTISSLQDKFSKVSQEYAEKTKSEAADGEKAAQSLVSNLMSEVEGLQKFAKNLPAEGQKRMEPLMELLSKTYKDLSGVAFDSNVAIQERAAKVQNYLGETTVPELQKLVKSGLKTE